MRRASDISKCLRGRLEDFQAAVSLDLGLREAVEAFLYGDKDGHLIFGEAGKDLLLLQGQKINRGPR